MVDPPPTPPHSLFFSIDVFPKEVLGHVEVLLQHDSVGRPREHRKYGGERYFVVLGDACGAGPHGRVLHAAQPKQAGHRQRLLEEAVDEDDDHVGVGAGGGEQGLQHAVEVVGTVGGDDGHRDVADLSKETLTFFFYILYSLFCSFSYYSFRRLIR